MLRRGGGEVCAEVRGGEVTGGGDRGHGFTAEAALPKRLREKLAPIVIPVEEQDYNDLTKAMRYVLEHHPDVTDIHILGATGLREDHTVGNLGLLMEYTRMFDLAGIRVEMVSDYSTAFAITDSCELHVGKGRRVSLFSPDNSLTIKSEGLHWPSLVAGHAEPGRRRHRKTHFLPPLPRAGRPGLSIFSYICRINNKRSNA